MLIDIVLLTVEGFVCVRVCVCVCVCVCECVYVVLSAFLFVQYLCIHESENEVMLLDT